MEQFDEEITAKEAIAASPDVTEGVEQMAGPTAGEKALISSEEQPLISEPSAYNKRDARLLVKGLKKVTKDRLDEDQLSVIEEVSAEGFGILSALNVPKALKIALTILLAAIPLVPIFIQTASELKETKEEFANDGLN